MMRSTPERAGELKTLAIILMEHVPRGKRTTNSMSRSCQLGIQVMKKKKECGRMGLFKKRPGRQNIIITLFLYVSLALPLPYHCPASLLNFHEDINA